MKNQNELEERLKELESRLEKLESKVRHDEKSMQEAKALNVGMLTYRGKYESSDRKIGSTFAGDVSIDKILKMNSNEVAHVIDAFSTEERVDIVKLLLKKPLTAKEIMEILNFPTTGKVYHHLSFLEKLGIINKNNEKYSIAGKSVACVVLIMLGVSQIIEGRN